MSEEEVIISIKSCINSSKGGVPLSRINYDYREMMGEDIPYFNLGYSSLRSFIQSIRDIAISKTYAGGEMLICCGGKAAHIAELVSRQKSTSKPARKRPSKVISLPRRFREFNGQPCKSQTKYGSSTRDHKYDGFKGNLPPRFRTEGTWGDMSGNYTEKFTQRAEDDFVNLAKASNLNGPSSLLKEEIVPPKVSRHGTAREDSRKSRLLHSQKFLKGIVDGVANSGKAAHLNGLSSSLKEETLAESTKVDPKSRLLRGPSVYASVKTDEDTALHDTQTSVGTTTKHLTITVSGNIRNVMCNDKIALSSPVNSLSDYDASLGMLGSSDHSPVFEGLRTFSPPSMSYGAQGDVFDVGTSSLVGRVASQRLVGRVASRQHINKFRGTEQLPTASMVDYYSTGDGAAVDDLIQDFHGLKVVETASAAVVEPVLFHHLLIGDDFLLDLAHSYLGAKCRKIGDVLVSCGLCHSGQNIKGCLRRVKKFKLLSKVMLMLGAVDILEGSSLEDLKCDMLMLVKHLCGEVKTLVVLTVPPLPLTDDPVSWRILMAFNWWLVEVIEREFSSAKVVDLWQLFEFPRGQICEDMFEDCSKPMYKHLEEVLLWNAEGRRQLVNFLRERLWVCK